MADTVELRFQNGRGQIVTREVRQLIDIRDYIGTPGYALLAVAANTHLSVPDLDLYLERHAHEQQDYKVLRSFNWLQKRRWLFLPPGIDNSSRYLSDKDGKQARAVAIMREHTELSLYKLRALLKEHGIGRSKEWIRKHRCDELAV